MKKLEFSTYVNPLTDFGFHRVFGNENNKDLLIDFLNEIIKEEGLITDIEYLPVQQLGNTDKDRKAIFDIYCKNESGEYFIVEMQKARQANFAERSIYYSTFPIQRQAQQGNWNFHLKTVYLIGILDFTYLKDKLNENHYQERAYLTWERTKEPFSKKLIYIYIQLPQFEKTVEELKTNADWWLFCLKNLARLNEQPAAVQGKIFEKLFKTLEINRLNEEDMKLYNKSILEYNDVRNAMDYAREEGKEEGRETGLQIRTFEIAKNMLVLHYSVNDIAKITGLSPEEIASLGTS